MKIIFPPSEWLKEKRSNSKKQTKVVIASFFCILFLMVTYRFCYDPILYLRYESAIKSDSVDKLHRTDTLRQFSEEDKLRLLEQAISKDSSKTMKDLLGSGEVYQAGGYGKHLLAAFDDKRFKAAAAIVQHMVDYKGSGGTTKVLKALAPFFDQVYSVYRGGDVENVGFHNYVGKVCGLSTCVNYIANYFITSGNVDALSLLIQDDFDVNQPILDERYKPSKVEHRLKYLKKSQVVGYEFGRPVYAMPRMTWSETLYYYGAWNTPLLLAISHHVNTEFDPVLLYNKKLRETPTPENYQEIIKLLIDNGADLNLAGKDGRTPAMLAARLGNVEMLPYFLEHGAAFSIVDKDGRNLVHYVVACRNTCGKEKMLKWVYWLKDQGVASVDKDHYGLNIGEFVYVQTELKVR